MLMVLYILSMGGSQRRRRLEVFETSLKYGFVQCGFPGEHSDRSLRIASIFHLPLQMIIKAG